MCKTWRFRKNSNLAKTGLPTLCFKKVWKVCEVRNVLVTAGHRPAQAQEEPAGWGALPIFVWSHRNLWQNRVKTFKF